MKTLLISSCCLMMLIGSAGVKALPTIVNSDGNLVVETDRGRVEINNGNITIRGFNNSSNSQQSISQNTQSTISSVNSNFSHSTNTVSLDRNLLAKSHLLILEANDTMQGKVTLDGEVIQEVSGKNMTLDLSSQLSPGEHQLIVNVESLGNDMIQMKFQSPNSSIQQSTNKALYHTLNLNVK